MFICHVALQGCLTLQDVPYGLTADTGGHIKYLLELADASAKDPSVHRIDLVTRGFVDSRLGEKFRPGESEHDGKVRLVRIADGEEAYLPGMVELLHQDILLNDNGFSVTNRVHDNRPASRTPRH